MNRLFLLFALMFAACAGTRTEQRVSTGMTAVEVKRAMGEPFSRARSMEGGVPVDLWVYRDVQHQSDGRKQVIDTAVTLRDDNVVEVSHLSAKPAAEVPTAQPFR